jgi:hypothetical protein
VGCSEGFYKKQRRSRRSTTILTTMRRGERSIVVGNNTKIVPYISLNQLIN